MREEYAFDAFDWMKMPVAICWWPSAVLMIVDLLQANVEDY